MTGIGQRIKDLRKKADMTQDRLADYLGVSAQAVSKWECGISAPDLSLIPPLCCLLGCSADELLGITREEIFTPGDRNCPPGLYIGRPEEGKSMFKASFQISADKLDFDAVRDALSMEPALCRKKEDAPPASRERGLAKDLCLFSTLFCEVPAGDDPGSILNSLLDSLIGKEKVINELKEKYRASTRFVVTFSTFRNPQIRFPERCLDFLCATQTPLDVDSYVYPQD